MRPGPLRPRSETKLLERPSLRSSGPQCPETSHQLGPSLPPLLSHQPLHLFTPLPPRFIIFSLFRSLPSPLSCVESLSFQLQKTDDSFTLYQTCMLK